MQSTNLLDASAKRAEDGQTVTAGKVLAPMQRRWPHRQRLRSCLLRVGMHVPFGAIFLSVLRWGQ